MQEQQFLISLDKNRQWVVEGTLRNRLEYTQLIEEYTQPKSSKQPENLLDKSENDSWTRVYP